MSAQPLRYRTLWHAVGAGLVLLVIYLSLTPNPVHTPSLVGFDPGHIAAYLVLMLWYAQILPMGRARIAAAVALVALGVGLEYVQGLTSYRTFDLADMRDDAVGVAVGFALALTPLGAVLRLLERRVAG
jgi:VanZ family protein